VVIRAQDRVSTVIARDESVIDIFVALSPAFERLRNAGMRRVMARLVTVEQAARVAGVDAAVLLARLNAHFAQPDGDAAAAHTPSVQHEQEPAVMTAQLSMSPRPAALARIDADRIVTADVRDELRAGREPFSIIMAARREVTPGGALCVRAIFEPVPLYAVMAKQGLAHWTERLADDDWRVWFYDESAHDVEAAADNVASAPHPDDTGSVPDAANPDDDDVVILDVRGLEPPEPMLRTLAALEQLPYGSTLVQLNVRVPQFLLPLLDERGFTYDIREQDADLVRLFIRHRQHES
jgi:hypothetical protein